MDRFAACQKTIGALLPSTCTQEFTLRGLFFLFSHGIVVFELRLNREGTPGSPFCSLLGSFPVSCTAYGPEYLANATLDYLQLLFPSCLKDLASLFCGITRWTARRITLGSGLPGTNSLSVGAYRQGLGRQTCVFFLPTITMRSVLRRCW